MREVIVIRHVNAAFALDRLQQHGRCLPSRRFLDRLDAIAIGPGLGHGRAEEVIEIVREFANPMVVDADALNIISEHPETLSRVAGPRLLTPHPGEMKRLSPNGGEDRATQARRFVADNAVTLLLKGSRTIVAERGKPLSYNTTGTPAMASGGMGDVLTGVCAALISQHLSCYDAARLASPANFVLLNFDSDQWCPCFG